MYSIAATVTHRHRLRHRRNTNYTPIHPSTLRSTNVDHRLAEVVCQRQQVWRGRAARRVRQKPQAQKVHSSITQLARRPRSDGHHGLRGTKMASQAGMGGVKST